jgi:hypothetical protein
MQGWPLNERPSTTQFANQQRHRLTKSTGHDVTQALACFGRTVIGVMDPSPARTDFEPSTAAIHG